MLSVEEWKRWFLYQLIGEGVHNAIYHEQILKELGKHYDINLDRALRDLIDDGIIMLIESKKKKKYIVNFESLSEAQTIISIEKNTKIRKDKAKKIHDHDYVNYMDSVNEKKIVQPFLPRS